MKKTPLKIAALSAVALAFATGSAFAGDGKNCDHKKKTAMKTEAAAAQTAVLSTSTDGKMMTKKAKRAYTFEEALKVCQEKGADDLQACVDYKTGVTQPKS